MRLVVITFVLVVTSTEGVVKSSCDSSTVQKGLTATITCHFSTDMQTRRVPIYLDYTAKGKNDLETILHCKWTTTYSCTPVSSRYIQVGVISDQLTLQIPDVSEEHSGQYWCYVFESRESDIGRCDLSVIQVENENKVLSSKKMIVTDESTLHTSGVTTQLSSISSDNISGVSEYPIEDEIQFEPSRSIVEIWAGDSLLQICNAACRPNCTLTWRKMNITLSEESSLEVVDGRFLNISNIQLSENGTYTCVAVNRDGRRTHRQLSVVVKESQNIHGEYSGSDFIIIISASSTAVFVVSIVISLIIACKILKGRAKYIRPKHRRRQEVVEYTDLDTQYHYVEVEQNETSVYDEIGDVTTDGVSSEHGENKMHVNTSISQNAYTSREYYLHPNNCHSGASAMCVYLLPTKECNSKTGLLHGLEKTPISEDGYLTPISLRL